MATHVMPGQDTRVTLMCWTCEPREPTAKGDESLPSGLPLPTPPEMLSSSLTENAVPLGFCEFQLFQLTVAETKSLSVPITERLGPMTFRQGCIQGLSRQGREFTLAWPSLSPRAAVSLASHLQYSQPCTQQ